MNNELRQLAARIWDELLDLDRIIRRVEEGWQRAQRLADDYYLDLVQARAELLAFADFLEQRA